MASFNLGLERFGMEDWVCRQGESVIEYEMRKKWSGFRLLALANGMPLASANKRQMIDYRLIEYF